jgi:lipase chaperone LimK
MESSFFATRRATDPDRGEDPLLTHGLRDTLEALLTEALEDGATDPAALKQRLAALVGKHFPAALATRALALAERYVDYRVALGQLRPPQDPNDPGALREALEARHKVRQQFFDGPEHDALFAREAELDRYTLARLEIARNTQLTAEQRAQALRDAENELPAVRRAERAATTEHLNAAAQTAAFNAQNTDERTRHAARSAQYGEAAAHAMAQLDREEQHWQQRLDQYNQARGQQGEGPALQQLRQQLFSAEEQQRIDAALALRRLPPTASGS